MISSATDEKGGSAGSSRAYRVCLAGSGGGHLRQLLDLRPSVSAHDIFFITEDTPLSRSLAERAHFVEHFAFGQARIASPLKLVTSATRNFVQSAKIIAREKPDVLISTGAGSVLFSLLWARLFGAKIVMIESFARFDGPSLFGRLAAPFAHRKIVQSAKLSSRWPDAAVFDPLKVLDTPRPAKQPLLFVTVGTVMPFDRLTAMVAELKREGAINERVFMQVGVGGVRPPGVETTETLTFDAVQAILKDADTVVCHGGTGSIITALREGCRVIAAPRLFRLNEHYDDHQEEITSALAARGLLKVANTKEELAEALIEVKRSEPRTATSDPAELVAYLNTTVANWASSARVN